MLCLFITTGGGSCFNTFLGLGSGCCCQCGRRKCFQSTYFHCEEWCVCISLFYCVILLKGGKLEMYTEKSAEYTKSFPFKPAIQLTMALTAHLHSKTFLCPQRHMSTHASLIYSHIPMALHSPCTLSPPLKESLGTLETPFSPFECAKTVCPCCGRHTGCPPPSAHTAKPLINKQIERVWESSKGVEEEDEAEEEREIKRERNRQEGHYI